MSIQIRSFIKATLEGDQWEPICNEGRLIGYHAQGTNCSVYLEYTKALPEAFDIPEDGRIILQDGLAILPITGQPPEDLEKGQHGHLQS